MDDANLVQILKKTSSRVLAGVVESKAADLDKRGITNAQLNAFMRRSNLIGAQVHCWEQVCGSGCNDGPEAIHLH